MSGRPKAFTSWAAGVYAVLGKGWDSTARRVANVNGFFTPDVPASAQEVNDAIGTVVDNTNLLLNLCGQAAALNWPSGSADVTTGGSLPLVNGAAFDNKYGRWLLFGVKTGTVSANLVYSSDNGGRTWAAAGGANPGAGACDGMVKGALFNAATGKLAACTYSGASGTMDPTALTDEESRLNIQLTGNVAGLVFNGLYVFAGRNNTTTPLVQTSPLGASGVWTNRAPAFGAPTTWGGANGYALAASPTVALCVAIGPSNYGETVYSTNGTTWTIGGHTFSAGWFNTGMCFAADRFVIVQSNGTDSRTIYSLDGVNWNTGGSIVGSYMGGIASCGALIFSDTYTHAGNRGAWSTDGGLTWQFGGQFSITYGSAGTPDTLVYSNGAQFAVVNASKASFSSYMGAPG